jgi:hypothetical protein
MNDEPQGKYDKLVQQDGLRTTICEHRYELLVKPLATISEQQAVQAFRDWVRERNAKVVRLAGFVPE